MAAIDLSAVSRENPDEDKVYAIAFSANHAIGRIVKPNGADVAAVGDPVGGIIVRVGDASGNASLVMRRGILRGVKGAGAAVNAEGWSAGDTTVTDTKPAGAAGTRLWHLLVISEQDQGASTFRAHVNVTAYERGA